MSQVTYTIIVKVNGKTLPTTNASVMTGGVERESKTIAGRAGAGFTEKPVPGGAKCTVLNTSDQELKLDEIRGWRDITLVLEGDDGSTWQIDHAFLLKPPEIGDEGKGFECEFEGPPAKQLS